MLSAFCCYQVIVRKNNVLTIEHLFESELASRTAANSSALGYTHLIGPAKLDERILAKVNRYAEINLKAYHDRAKEIVYQQ